MCASCFPLLEYSENFPVVYTPLKECCICYLGRDGVKVIMFA